MNGIARLSLDTPRFCCYGFIAAAAIAAKFMKGDIAMPEDKKKPLDCARCLAFCCKMAGYVEVSSHDIRRLAKHLGLSVRDFEAKHIVKKTRAGRKRIKAGDEACQFLGEDRSCTVYAARPRDCRGYVCWDQDDNTVYDFARFTQFGVDELRKIEEKEEAEARQK
jgi:Fe-S-cluster containining protein